MSRRHRAKVAWTLVVVMTLSPTLGYCQQPSPKKAGAEAKPPAAAQRIALPAGTFDLSYVTPDTVAAVAAFPRRVLTSPEMELLPIEVLSAAGLKELGIDPVEIEQALAIVEPPSGNTPPTVGIVLHMASPLREGKLLPMLRERTTEEQLDGKTYRKGRTAKDLSIFLPDDRTLIVAHDAILKKMLAGHKGGKMSRMLGYAMATPANGPPPPDLVAIVLSEPLRPLIAEALKRAPVPPPLADLKKVPDLVNYVAVKVSITGAAGMSLAVKAEDEAAAKQLEEIIDGLLKFARQQMMAEVSKQAASPDPVEQALAKYMQRVSGGIFEALRPVRTGDTLTLAASGKGNALFGSPATIGILIGLLLPAVQAAREAGRRAQSMSNLSQIGMAMVCYAGDEGAFPARANFDKQGKPLLSWRVHILPYLDRKELYLQFHLDEPWDGPHNKPLIAKMPTIYRNPSGVAAPGMANYLAVVGKGLAFDADKGRSVADFKDGVSHTILVVEADHDHAVIWTKPDDWGYDAQRPMAGLGKAHRGGFGALFADGSVQFLATDLDVTVLKAMLTIAGGEAVRGGGRP